MKMKIKKGIQMIENKKIKEFYKQIIFTYFLTFLFSTTPLKSFAAEKIVFKSDPWCPYICQDTNLPGIFVEIAKAAMEENKMQFEYQTLNWMRAIVEARSGKTNALLGAAKVDAPDFIFHKTPIVEIKYEMFKLKSKKFNFTGKKANTPELKNLKIGVINGYGYDDYMMKRIDAKDPNIIVVSGDSALEKLIQMVISERIDAFYEAPMVFKNYQIHNASENINKIDSAGVPEQDAQQLFIAFSPAIPESKKYADWIDQQLKKLKKNNQYEALLNKYVK